jgi:glycosyltransferase involved in cell wall biosynthesis
MMFSLVIPVYRNEDSIVELVSVLEGLSQEMGGDFEAVLVVDGSPDRSATLLAELLPQAKLQSQLLVLSRNFGSFAAIRAGMAAARGQMIGVMSADLQEPAELILAFREKLLTGQYDVVVGTRVGRGDSLGNRLASSAFWWLYRSLVQPEVPKGGVDVFACTREFRDHLLALLERNTSLVGLIFWLGFRRGEVPYTRLPRKHGRSAWSFRRRFKYLLDSALAFSDLPVKLISASGLVGMLLSAALGLVVLWAKASGRIQVPGYAATVLTVMFFGGLNSFSLGLIGEYIWRTFENSKGRPGYVIAVHRSFERGNSYEQREVQESR